ncbi:hypothetical protein [Lutibacter sp.]
MKSSIFTIIVVVLISSNSNLFSQQRGGRGNSSQGQMTMPKVSPQNMAKIIIYDSDEVLKKLKLKSAQKKTIVNQAISKHNTKINELKIFNYETFNNVKTFLDKKREEAILNRDFSTMKESRMKANEMLAPIRAESMKQQMILNNTLNKELSEKEYKKWLKYQQAELKKLNPKNTQKPQMQRQGQMRGSGRNGQGRSRY